MEITTNELRKIIETTARFAVQEFQNSIGAKGKFISQTKAWNLYGRNRVQMWVRIGAVHPVKNGDKINCKTLYEKGELELAMNTERITSPSYNV